MLLKLPLKLCGRDAVGGLYREKRYRYNVGMQIQLDAATDTTVCTDRAADNNTNTAKNIDTVTVTNADIEVDIM